MLDEISEAVLSREELLKYPREQVNAYLDELRTTQRHKFYRALQHPLYPILRKIERRHENLHHVSTASRTHRVVYASNHKSHTDYLVEPLVLDDNGIRPPLIAAGRSRASWRKWCVTPSATGHARSSPSGHRLPPPTAIRGRAPTSSNWRGWSAIASAPSTRSCRRRCSPRRCGRRSPAPTWRI